MTKLDVFIFIAVFPSRLANWALNRAFSVLCGARVRIIWSGVKILGISRISIGNNFSSGRGLLLEAVGDRSSIEIGENVTISDWVHIGAFERVTIGDGCLIASKVIITDHAHGTVADIAAGRPPTLPNSRSLHTKGPVAIGECVWLGDGVAVLPGVTIGAFSIIGANSVVTCNVPENTVWAGSPARQVWPKQS